MGTPAIGGKPRLAIGHGGAQDALLALQHGVDRRAHFVADGGILSFQIQKRNGHGGRGHDRRLYAIALGTVKGSRRARRRKTAYAMAFVSTRACGRSGGWPLPLLSEGE